MDAGFPGKLGNKLVSEVFVDLAKHVHGHMLEVDAAPLEWQLTADRLVLDVSQMPAHSLGARCQQLSEFPVPVRAAF